MELFAGVVRWSLWGQQNHFPRLVKARFFFLWHYCKCLPWRPFEIWTRDQIWPPKTQHFTNYFLNGLYMNFASKPGILFSGPISNIDLGNGLVPIRQQALPEPIWPKMPVTMVCLSLPMHMTKNKEKGLKFIHISGMYHLFTLALSVMVGNTKAERVFTVQNRIKTGIRNRLCIERLDQLIRVSCTKVNRDDFDFEAAQDQFMQMVQHRI